MAAASAHLFKPLFLLSSYRLRGLAINLPSTNTNSLINYHFQPQFFLPTLTNYGCTTTPSTRRMLCYCTEETAYNSKLTATKTTLELDSLVKEKEDADDSKKMIKDAANTLDIRVGRIVKVWRHEEADSLYVEEVDVGEPQPRTICSGLVNYIPLHLLQDRNVIVLANLKPRNMRGVKSSGMLMAASDATHEKVKLLVPPEGAVPGERVWFGSDDEKDNLPDAASPNQLTTESLICDLLNYLSFLNRYGHLKSQQMELLDNKLKVQKKKIWELVQPYLRTDDSCVAVLGMHHMRTSAGVIICDSLRNAKIS